MTQVGITIIADEGKTFVRISDNYRMGPSIQLGMDYSTGNERVDLPEYYREEDMTEEEKQAESKSKNTMEKVNNHEKSKK